MQPQSPTNPPAPTPDTPPPADLPAVQPPAFTPPPHMGAGAPQPAAASAPTADAATANTATAPAMADDGDLIEKEWVTKVKQIVASTAQDPYEQSRQFSALKADYLQKRYGKSLKSES